MLELIINTITWIKQFMYYGLVLSYSIGKGIFIGVKYILQIFENVYCFGQSLLTIMFEDFSIFLKDVVQHTRFILFGIYSSLEESLLAILYIINIIKVVLGSTIIVVVNGITSISSGIFKPITYIGQLYIGIKQLLILIGSGIWFTLTLIPLFLLYLVSLPISIAGMICYRLKQITVISVEEFVVWIKITFKFMFDMPLEAFVGLMAGVCIVYVLLKFYVVLYHWTKEKVQSLARIVSAFLSRLRTNNSFKVQRKRTPKSDADLALDGYCVICQEQEKCVLILPCKHLCLCNECSNNLRYYDRRCPICRSYATKTMKIYL